VKIPVTEQIVKYSDWPIWHQKPYHAQNCLNHLSSPFGVQEIVLTRTTPLNALKQLPCDWLIQSQFSQRESE